MTPDRDKSNTVAHTPGPWEIYTGETFGDGPDDWTPRALYADIYSKRTTIATFRIDFPHGEAQQRQNARLIAAAPCLLEALKAMMRESGAAEGNPDSDSPAEKLARAAIQRAGGEQ